MKTWFKARMTWGAGIEALSDAEAGRFAKALWQYVTAHEETPLQGSEKVLFALALMELRQDEAEAAELSNVRAVAGRIGGKQKQANQANATFAKQDEANQASDTNKNKNKKEDKEKEIDSNSITTAFGDVYINTVQDYAQRYLVGLTSTHLEEVDQYSEIMGEELVKHAIDESIANGVRSWAYVRAILRGYMKDNIKTIAQAEQAKESHKKAVSTQGKQVTAQQYTQRDYTEDELEARTTDLLQEAASL